MKAFEIGSRHQLYFDNDVHTGIIIYNNGKIAIAGLDHIITREDSFDYSWEHSPFAMTKEEITAFVADFDNGGPYCSFLVVDMDNGCLIELREWFRRNNALFVLGEKYHSTEEWDKEIGNSITVYRMNGIAIIKIFDGEGCVYNTFKQHGHSEEEVRSVFPGFKDYYPVECKESFYLCVRECNDRWIDLHGNPIDEDIYGCL